MSEPKPLNAAMLARLRFIDFVLEHFRILSRRHLVDYFGISEPQASLDINRYLEAAPANLAYDLSARVYRAGPAFVRLFP